MADQSLLAAVSGIRANQTYLAEIGDNIANAETVGYKEGTVQFGDLLSEQVSGGAAPATGGGGVNPIAIGSGVRVAAVTTQLSEGSLMFTGQATDVAITGTGYLVVESHGQQLYTRDGALTRDASGELTTASGARIQGWEANATGVIDTTAPTGPVTIPTGATIAAHATSKFYVSGNLPAWSGSGTQLPATITYDAYDSLGQVVPVTVTFTPVTGSADEWTVTAKAKGATGATVTLLPTGKTAPVVAFTSTSGQIKSC
ncbi:MAG: flagellar hook-basal body complex protein, partial [Acidimicrobiales bacterium]